MALLRFAAVALLVASPAFAQIYGIGRTPSADELRRLDISIGPAGEELPDGRGTVKEGATLFQRKGCVACHGEGGKGDQQAGFHTLSSGWRGKPSLQLPRRPSVFFYTISDVLACPEIKRTHDVA